MRPVDADETEETLMTNKFRIVRLPPSSPDSRERPVVRTRRPRGSVSGRVAPETTELVDAHGATSNPGHGLEIVGDVARETRARARASFYWNWFF